MNSHKNDTKGQYPDFEDGDTTVIVSGTPRLTLHRHILRRSSTKLFHELDSEGAQLTKKVLSNGANIPRWRLQYKDRGANFEFENVPLDNKGEPLYNAGITNYNGRVIPADVRAVLMLFKAFYHIDLGIDRRNMGTILVDVTNLLSVAQVLGSVSSIRLAVENALIAEGQSLWEAVATSPHCWIGMACQLRSRIIYKNCFIHLVGRYQVFCRTLANTDLELPKATTVIDSLPPGVRDKVEAKYNEFFAKRCAYVESLIMTYYPPALRRTAEAGRKDYSNDIYLHMALSLFRHWFGLQVIQGRNHLSSEDGGWAFYQELLTGDQAYLTREDVREWHGMFPMSGKGSMVVQNHLTDIKCEASNLVKDLFANKSSLADDSPTRKWLTFITVRDDDFSWNAIDQDTVDNAEEETETGAIKAEEVISAQDQDLET
ncbi:hypothetical protein MBLNU457_1542t1 [Dothideomycetes sp. NU457]